jgi:hypothetical protein
LTNEILRGSPCQKTRTDAAGGAAAAPAASDAADSGVEEGPSEELQVPDQEEFALFMCAPALTLTKYDSVVVSFVAEM